MAVVLSFNRNCVSVLGGGRGSVYLLSISTGRLRCIILLISEKLNETSVKFHTVFNFHLSRGLRNDLKAAVDKIEQQ